MKLQKRDVSESVEILIVEDSPTQAEQLRHLLEARGFTVTAAANGKQALAAARHRKPTLIISDVLMPEMDGFTLCERIKASAELKEIPIILVTSLSSPPDVVKGLASGADNFIRKPYEGKYLLARIDYILTTRELRKREKTQLGVGIFFGGREYFINSERQQILDLLISTYEEAVHINEELDARQKDLARSYHVLNGLYRIAAELNESMSQQEVADNALERALELPGIEAGWIYLREGESGFWVAAVRGLPAQVELSGKLIPECFCVRELLNGTFSAPVNVTECERLRNAREDTHGLRYHASIPLRIGGKTLGIMNLVGKERRLFTDDELKVLDGVGKQVATALDRAQLVEQLERKVEERTSTLKAEIAERKRAEEALRASEERYRLLFESNPQPTWVFDLESLCFLAVNDAAVNHYGYSREEFLAMTIKDIRPPEEVPALLENIAKTGMRGLNRAGVWRHRKKDGSTIDVEITSHPLLFSGRRAELVLAGDITERKRLEEQLRQAQKMEAVGRLAGGIAHDFNNLVTIINGYSQLLLDRVEPAGPVQGYIEEIKKAGDRAASLTRQLLAFSRKQVLAPQVVDLNGVVANMDKMLRRLIGEDVDLAASCAPALGRVKTDPGQIEQVIMNLAVNARDAMPHGGKLTLETANVELDETYAHQHASVKPGPYVMLAVSDTGCGMDAETLAHIFEPFFTTKEKGKGTGLGLSTVYGIVKQSGGNIWVYSEPGQGTTFKIYMPREEEPVPTADRGKPRAEQAKGTETILLVEDETALRSLVRGVLESNGYKVLEARDGEDALHVCEQHKGPIHLLLTDVVMPQMSGRELAEHLAPFHRETKVLYMSGYTDNAILHHGVLDPGTAFLQKPFSPEALARKVREALGN